MRKLLLGSTAVAAAALFAPTGAMAQGNDPFASGMGAGSASLRGLEVRVGGYFRAMYMYVDQTSASQNDAAGNRLGKSDFSEEIEIHILANGKAANGLRYGVALEIENDVYRTPGVISSTTTGNGASATGKNSIGFDEAWAYLAGPWGQIRYGEEDGAIQQLQSGFITGFGIGGLDSGDTYQQVVGGAVRPGFGTVNDLLDNTKVMYLSPQFFGFDAGASFAFNTGEGPLGGCDSLSTITSCDRLGSFAGLNYRRRNEIQAALRWRGSFGPAGLAATVGYIGSDAVNNGSQVVNAGYSPRRIDQLWTGATATAYGFTVGGTYSRGTANFGGASGTWGTMVEDRANARADDRTSELYQIGATYTLDAITVGGHFFRTLSAGSQVIGTGGLRQTGFAVGGNYRVAPGLDFFAEYNQVQRKERNVDLLTSTTALGTTRGTDVGIVIAGFRVAF